VVSAILLAKVVPWASDSVVPPPSTKVPVPETEPEPVRKVRPPVPDRVMSELMTMLPCALSVRVRDEAEVMGALTVMLPAWLPVVPVNTVTSVVLSAVCSVVALICVLSAIAV
jgi:hypothetical protein